MNKDIEIYKKCYDILKSKNLHAKEQICSLCEEIFRLAKSIYGIENFTLEIKPCDNQKLSEINHKTKILTLNENLLKKRELYNILNTIFCQLHLEYQIQNRNYKKLDIAPKVTLPVKKTNKNIFLLPAETKLTPQLFKITAQAEQDATNYAHSHTTKFFEEMEKYLSSDTQPSDKLKRFLKIQNHKELKLHTREKYLFYSAIEHLDFSRSQYEKIIEDAIRSAINDLRNAMIIKDYYQCTPAEKEDAQKCIDKFPDLVDAFMQIYCSENTKYEILKYCEEYKIIDAIYPVFNSPFSQISKYDFDYLFKITSNNNIPLEEIQKNLTEWKSKDIKLLYDRYIKNQIAEQECADLF